LDCIGLFWGMNGHKKRKNRKRGGRKRLVEKKRSQKWDDSQEGQLWGTLVRRNRIRGGARSERWTNKKKGTKPQ